MSIPPKAGRHDLAMSLRDSLPQKSKLRKRPNKAEPEWTIYHLFFNFSSITSVNISPSVFPIALIC
jgi:hypothetical protein